MAQKKYMAKYKSDFIISFARIIQDNLLIFKALQETFKRRLYTKDLIWYFVAFCIGFIPFEGETSYCLGLHLLIGLVPFTLAILILIGVENKKYQEEIKKTCFPKLLKVFDSSIKYDRSNIIKDHEFENSGLYDHRIESRTDDDCFYGTYNNIDFVINETDFGYYTRDSKGRRHYNRMFKGVAMRFMLKKSINAHVLIHSKSLFRYVPGGYGRVEVEYADFIKNYNVYVNPDNYDGQIEARYLLNVAFLDRFMQLKTSFGPSSIKLSVKGDTMLVMLATGRDLFEMNHLLGKIDDVNQYKHLFDEFASVLSFIDVLNLSSKTGF